MDAILECPKLSHENRGGAYVPSEVLNPLPLEVANEASTTSIKVRFCGFTRSPSARASTFRRPRIAVWVVGEVFCSVRNSCICSALQARSATPPPTTTATQTHRSQPLKTQLTQPNHRTNTQPMNKNPAASLPPLHKPKQNPLIQKQINP